MGLAIIHGIVTSHEGAIAVASVPGYGATFEIYLPRITASLGTDVPPEEPPPWGQGNILVVDDEASVTHI